MGLVVRWVRAHGRIVGAAIGWVVVVVYGLFLPIQAMHWDGLFYGRGGCWVLVPDRSVRE